MNRSEAAKILGLAAARDRRTVGESDVLAWATDLADIDFDEAREAVSRHYRGTAEWLMPVHIRAIVRSIHEDRRRQQPHAIRALPSRFEATEDAARRAHDGAAKCRAELGARVDEGNPADDDPVRDRALRRVRSERRSS